MENNINKRREILNFFVTHPKDFSQDDIHLLDDATVNHQVNLDSLYEKVLKLNKKYLEEERSKDGEHL